MPERGVNYSLNSALGAIETSGIREAPGLCSPRSQNPGLKPLQVVSLENSREPSRLSSETSATLENPRIKVVILGDSFIGKTNFIYSLLGKDFDENVGRTEFNNYWYTIASKESPTDAFKLHIWDLGGRLDDSTTQARRLCYEDGTHTDVFILCFSVINRQSFENIRKVWRKEILKYWDETASVILVGLQSEMRKHKYPDGTIPAGIVLYDEAKLLAKKLSFSKYIECSAKVSWNIERIFAEAVRIVLVNSKLENKLGVFEYRKPAITAERHWKSRVKALWRKMRNIFGE